MRATLGRSGGLAGVLGCPGAEIALGWLGDGLFDLPEGACGPISERFELLGLRELPAAALVGRRIEAPDDLVAESAVVDVDVERPDAIVAEILHLDQLEAGLAVVKEGMRG